MSGQKQYREGDGFVPYRMFTGLFVPEALARCTAISPAAKLVYGRLMRYAGKNGQCHPSLAKLAAEVGLKKRQVQMHIRCLEKAKLIRRIARKSKSGQRSNSYVFLWHEIFEPGVNNTAPGGMQDPAPTPVQDPAHKESQTEESHFEEKHPDLDRNARIAQSGDSRQEAICAKYPRLRTALSDYMTTGEDPERVNPKDRIVVDVMQAAGGASEDDVVQCLHYLRNERGLMPGTKHGPRTFSWFKTVIGDYFQQERNRQAVFTQQSSGQQAGTLLAKDELDEMGEAFDTTDN